MMLLRAVTATALLAFASFAAADVKSDLLASHEAMVKAAKFRMVGTVETDKGNDPLWSEVHWPDRFHTKNQGGEYILVPGKTWMKQGGQWMALPMDMSAMVKSLSPDAVRQTFDNMTNGKELGESEIAGRKVKGYEYDTFATIMGIRAESHVKVWVDPETKLVVRQETANKAAGQTSKVVQDYEYDASISVDPPM